jgi:hypothetical protein
MFAAAVLIGFNYTMAELLLRYRARPSGKWVLTAGWGEPPALATKNTRTLSCPHWDGGAERPGAVRHHLPLAISFFTFTQIAYLVDVYRDHTRHYNS